MKGLQGISQKDIIENPQKEDPIVVSGFPIDSHDCPRFAPKDGVINEGTIMPVRMEWRQHGYPYQIPYRSILPMPTECNNLLVPVVLSCTHVGLSSIRVEPTWMILGQSAGVAAALAAKGNATVQKLPYPTLRDRLLAQKVASSRSAGKLFIAQRLRNWASEALEKVWPKRERGGKIRNTQVQPTRWSRRNQQRSSTGGLAQASPTTPRPPATGLGWHFFPVNPICTAAQPCLVLPSIFQNI